MQPGRRIIGGVTVVAVALVVIGFGVAALDPALPTGGSGGTAGKSGGSAVATSPSTQSILTAAPTPSASPTRSARPTPSASIGVSPSPSAPPTRHPVGFAVVGETVFYFGEDGSSLPVVAVPGLEVQIQSGRAIYYALAGNKYGLKTGSYAGEFLPLVTMGQVDGSTAQTGGMVLAGPVVAKLLSDALAHITDDTNRWLVALPIDIRSARGGSVDVTFDDFGLSGIANTPRILINFSGSLPLVESIPGNGGVHVLVEGLNVTTWQVIDPARLALPPNKIDPAHAMNQLLIYGDGTASLNSDQLIDGRLPLGSPIMDVSGDVSISLVVNGSHADIGPDKVLQVSGVPVFIASSS
jgi:hypothetical protein